MITKQISVFGAVLVLGGYMAASDDALAAGQGGLGQRPSQPVNNGTLNPARPQAQPPSNVISGSRIRNGNSVKPVVLYKW